MKVLRDQLWLDIEQKVSKKVFYQKWKSVLDFRSYLRIFNILVEGKSFYDLPKHIQTSMIHCVVDDRDYIHQDFFYTISERFRLNYVFDIDNNDIECVLYKTYFMHRDIIHDVFNFYGDKLLKSYAQLSDDLKVHVIILLVSVHKNYEDSMHISTTSYLSHLGWTVSEDKKIKMSPKWVCPEHWNVDLFQRLKKHPDFSMLERFVEMYGMEKFLNIVEHNTSSFNIIPNSLHHCFLTPEGEIELLN